MRFIFIIIVSIGLYSCSNPILSEKEEIPEFKVYSNPIMTPCEYKGFDSREANSRIASIENEYFNDFYRNKVSNYYGTVWRESAEQTFDENGKSLYQTYLENLHREIKPDSLHCTLYAYEGLKAGLDSVSMAKLMDIHKRIYKDHEIAGWSIGYILVKDFEWEAYLVLDKSSHEYEICIKSYNEDKSYPVWKRPNIPLKNLYVRGEDDEKITSLLNQHPFSWGFSDQGYHTWITWKDELKECNRAGAPANAYHSFGTDTPLFISTPFLEYHDYQSHVFVFPPKKELSQ